MLARSEPPSKRKGSRNTVTEPKIVVQSWLTREVPDIGRGAEPLLVWSRHPAYPDGWWLVYWSEFDGTVGSVQHRIGGDRGDGEGALKRARRSPSRNRLGQQRSCTRSQW